MFLGLVPGEQIDSQAPSIVSVASYANAIDAWQTSEPLFQLHLG